ncbi:MAG: hypothetical protein WCT42_02810 [Candidatus Paceibacterota bacterium]|jgi:hypothetical protein
MNKIMKWLTLKLILIISLVSAVGFLIILPRQFFYALSNAHCFLCVYIAKYAGLFFIIGATTLIPSIIMLFSKKQQIFESWKKTLFIYLSIYLLIIILVPWYTKGDFVHLQKDLVALGFSIIYLVFSIIFIIYKSFKKE